MGPRIRTLKPEIWHSRDVLRLSILGRLAFVTLITLADDEGRLKIDAPTLATYLVPAPVDELEVQLEVMEARNMIRRYGGRTRELYVALCNWGAHQKIDRARPSSIPPPPISNPRRKVATNREPSKPPYARADQIRTDRIRSDQTGSIPPVPPEGEPSDLALEVQESREPVEAVFHAWQTATGKVRAKLDEKRRKLVRARLAEGWSTEELVLVVSLGWQNDPWNERVLHNGLEVLLRDAAHVEKFLSFARTGAPLIRPKKSNLELSVEADDAMIAALRKEGR